MNAKMKNPLYVVKGNNVEQAQNWFDMLVKKFDLEPVLRMLQQVLSMLLAQVQSYPVLALVKAWFDMVMEKFSPLLKAFA